MSQVEHSSMVGALAVAKAIIGEISSLKEFKVSSGRRIRPNQTRHEQYEKKYARYLEKYVGQM